MGSCCFGGSLFLLVSGAVDMQWLGRERGWWDGRWVVTCHSINKKRPNYKAQLGVSKNSGTPKWMIYNGNPLFKWMIWGENMGKTHHLRKHPVGPPETFKSNHLRNLSILVGEEIPGKFTSAGGFTLNLWNDWRIVNILLDRRNPANHLGWC